MKTPLVSVVFPTMNRKEMLLDCIESLYTMDWPKDKLEIVIADNGSKDGSVQAVRKRFPKVKVIANKNNLGSPVAINQCILKCKGDFIFRLDDDMIMRKECLKELMKVLQSDEKIYGAGYMMYYWDIKNMIRDFGMKFNMWTAKASIGYRDLIDVNQFNEPFQVDYTPAGTILFRRNIFLEAGLFDERMFLTHEDVDFSIKAKNLGYKLMLVPRAKGHHRKERGGTISPFMLYHGIRSRMIFMLKNAGFRNAFFLPMHFLVYLPVRSLQYILTGRFKHFTTIWKATFDGLFRPWIIAYTNDGKQFKLKDQQSVLRK
ncbi:MAG TPA: glycosyltransferase family 2 protein [Candidatus Nanoarchaeia archaeon]|nr:glycosyltransferase family 2 protein [Candidatus Nanoarchaeia archaeon]